MFRGLAMSTLLALASVAHAGTPPAPQFKVDEQGYVVGRITLEAPEDQVRSAVAALQHVNANTNVLDLRFAPDGNCQAVTRVTRGLISPLTMRTRLCPTVNGWRESLVSGDYNAYESEWIVHPDGARTTVQVRVRTEVSFAPAVLVQRGTIDGLHQTFAALLRRIAKARQPAAAP